MDAQDLLAALAADDRPRLGDALSRLPDLLRARAFDDAEIDRIAARLEELSRDERHALRRAVAQAVRYLRHDVADDLLRRLLADDNELVAKAARATQEHRLERAHVEALPLAAGEHVARLLDDLQRKHDKRARDAAVRVGLKYTDFMVSAMKHQVAAAMTPVGASLQTLEIVLADRPDALALLRTAQDHLEQVEAILESARTFVKRDPLAFRRTNVRALVLRVIETVRDLPLAVANGLDATVDVDAELELEAAPGALQEALVNVVKNAIEASAARAPIPLRVSARRHKGSIEIVVRDEGCGMSPEECEVGIWRPFGSQKEGGTGLGMPLVKKHVEIDHGGTVTVKSARGQGAVVTLLLPLQQGF